MLFNRENDRLNWPVIISCNRETKHLFTEDSEVV